jgi:hypothetical protein
MNKGRAYKIPGIGLAGDWPGAWTQTYAQIDTEAGMQGFDKNYFVQQVAGLSQLAGELMRVEPRVIDLGWGALKSAILKLDDSGREPLLKQYVSAFRHVERGALAEARTALKPLAETESLKPLVDGQLAKLA